MAASPRQAVINRHLRRIQKQCDKFNEEFGTQAYPRLLRASNGECAILIYVGDKHYYSIEELRRVYRDTHRLD